MEKQQEGRQWRKTVKKLQRKRRRQQAAKERDKQLEEEENDPAFQQWLQYQNEMEEYQRLVEERTMQEEEEAWQRRELIAQQQFRLERQRLAAQEAEKEALRQQQEKELKKREEAKRKRCEEHQRRVAEAATEFERIMKVMEDYLTAKEILEPPAELRRLVDTRPDEKLCEFFERTNCCRFGVTCIFNHRRPLLSSIIVIRNFFMHPLLEQSVHSEYEGADAGLETNERDMREDYDAFFEDVVPEMESFGKIMNFRTSCNAHPHLRGHVFVEYVEERSALKAFIKLQGRYYASKRLNVEFSNLHTWRGAICGLSLIRKCPKAQNCNYLHVFRNPENKYNTLLEYTQPTTYSLRKTPSVSAFATPALSWNDVGCKNDTASARNWRWSESPELELLGNQNNADVNTDASSKTEHDKRTNGKEDRGSQDRSRSNSSRKSSSCSRNKDSNSQEHSKGSLCLKKSSSKGHHSKKPSRSKSKNTRNRQTSRSTSKESHETTSSHSKTKAARKRETSRSKSRERHKSLSHSNSKAANSGELSRSKSEEHHEKSLSQSKSIDSRKRKTSRSKSKELYRSFTPSSSRKTSRSRSKERPETCSLPSKIKKTHKKKISRSESKERHQSFICSNSKEANSKRLSRSKSREHRARSSSQSKCKVKNMEDKKKR